MAADIIPEHQAPLAVSVEALIFKEHLERLFYLMLVLLLGGMIYLGSGAGVR